MELLKALITVSEKASNVARLCRQNDHLFQLLIQKKSGDEANPRFVEDFKTLADVLIQELVKHDIGKQFPDLRDSIRGEETNTFSNKLGESVRVEIKQTVGQTATLLERVLNGDTKAAELLAGEVHKNVTLDQVALQKHPTQQFDLCLTNVGIWIDPIDSTAEYIGGGEDTSSGAISAGGLKCVTVLIGVFDKKTSLPVVGVINQPFVVQNDTQWSGVCFWGHPDETSLPLSLPQTKTVCVSSSEDSTVIAKLIAKGYVITEAAGAGYKILTVITGLADAYILSKASTYKWDTCGPQALLRSLGGDVVDFAEALKNTITSVKYTQDDSKCNLGGIIAYRNKEVLMELITCLR